MNVPTSRLAWVLVMTLVAPACQSGEPEPLSRKRERERREMAKREAEKAKATGTTATPTATATATASAPPAAARTVADVKAAPGDPLAGKFSLADATKGLPGEGKLFAYVRTGKGMLTCELYEDKAPITVANFVGLARGIRPWEKDGTWVKEPLYDGTPFHRVIKGFMIQGGDPKGNGSGGPGYVIPDEIWEGAKHDKRGQLCMANRGPNTNGSQFFVMDGAAAHLDGGYTIFGMCEPESVIEAIANTPVRGDKAAEPVKIEKVKIGRK